MSDIPKTFTAEYYNRAYFSGDEGGKQFLRGEDRLDEWSYWNQSGESLASKFIVEGFKTVFAPKTMLDVGAGRGTIIAYAREADIEAYGFDWSKWATTPAPKLPDGSYDWSKGGMFPRCKPEWLIQYDGTKPLPYQDNQFDLVVALDYMEHMYVEDLPLVISEMYRVTKNYLFLEIDTVDGVREKGYIVHKGEDHAVNLEPNMVAGHITVVDENTWVDWFTRHDWMLRRDLTHWFISLVPENCIKNWLLNSILVWSK